MNRKNAAIAKICGDLGLPPGDSFAQDWEFELPEEFRGFDFFSRYVLAYATLGYGDAEKHLLMALMLDVANELLEGDEVVGRRAWESLVPLLRADYGLHEDRLEYWASPGMPLEDAFTIAPLVRALMDQVRR